MFSEKVKIQPDSELIKNPVTLVNKINSLLAEPDDQKTEQLGTWILKGWGEINEVLMQAPDYNHCDSNGNLIAKIEHLPIRDGATRYLKELGSKFEIFKSVDRLWVEMHFQSAMGEENPYIADILFAADYNNRNQLLGARLEYKTLERPKKPAAAEQIFEMKFSSASPILEVRKIK